MHQSQYQEGLVSINDTGPGGTAHAPILVDKPPGKYGFVQVLMRKRLVAFMSLLCRVPRGCTSKTKKDAPVTSNQRPFCKVPHVTPLVLLKVPAWFLLVALAPPGLAQSGRWAPWWPLPPGFC